MNAALLRPWGLLTTLALIIWPLPPGRAATGSQAPTSAAPDGEVERYAAGPGATVRFEENAGQTDEAVRYVVRTPGATLFLTDAEAVFALAEPPAPRQPSADPGRQERAPRSGRIVRMRAAGGSEAPLLTAGALLPGATNYFRGADPSRWRAGVRAFDSVRYEGVYPGVDLVYYSRDGALEYDFVVGPGADPRAVRLAFDGADAVDVDPDGSLVVRAGPCVLRHAPPAVYQPAGDARELVPGWYVAGPDGTVCVELGAYDAARPLVIDPTLSYSTFLGGGETDRPADVVVDGWGQAYVVGSTDSPDFPRVGAPWTYRSDRDVFLTVLGRAGMALVYSTYLGGDDIDIGAGVALDREGAVYLTGMTTSTDFPTVHPIETNADEGRADVFVAKLSPTGASLAYSTYLGGDGNDTADDVAVDLTGSAYIVGSTFSSDYPLVNAYDSDHSGPTEAIVTKVNAAGTALVYSTFLGGRLFDYAFGIAVNGVGEATVVGSTESDDFPRVNPVQNALRGPEDAFVTKFSASGAVLRFSTYVGGSGTDNANAVTVDEDGTAIVVGETASDDFPTRAPIAGEPGDHAADGFALRLTYGGDILESSTYLPGSAVDIATSVAVGADGRITVAGWTRSADFVTVNPLQRDTDGDEADAFVTCLVPSGSAVVYSTYLGGRGEDSATAVAVDGSGNAYLVGTTDSSSFPTVNPYQPANHGGDADAFIAKIGNATANLQVNLTAEPEPVNAGEQLIYRLTVANLGPNDAGDVIAAISVPAGTRISSFTAVPGHFVPPAANGVGYYYAGHVWAGLTASLRLVVDVEPSAAGGTIENAATAISTAADPSPADNTDNVVSHVTSGVVPPDIAGVEELVVSGKPYRIRIRGTNFQRGIQVFIGADTTPWPKVKRKNDATLTLKGAGLIDRFPPGVGVEIRLVNPDGGRDTGFFAR